MQPGPFTDLPIEIFKEKIVPYLPFFSLIGQMAPLKFVCKQWNLALKNNNAVDTKETDLKNLNFTPEEALYFLRDNDLMKTVDFSSRLLVVRCGFFFTPRTPDY